MGDAPVFTGGHWRKRLLAAGVAVLLALLALEGGVRLYHGAPMAERLPILRIEANEHRGWAMVAGETHYTYKHPVRINALGLRSPEVTAKVAGERRVLALGDSLIYGQGVSDEHTLPTQLQELLNQEGEGLWTVVNGGHRAYDVNQELGLLEELGPSIDPDVVVLFWFWNDVYEVNVAETHARLEASGPVTFDTGAPMRGWDKTRWHLHQLLRRSALLMLLHDLRKDGGHPIPPQTLDRAMKRLDSHLERFQALAAEGGFDPVVVVIPDANALQGVHQSTFIAARAIAVVEERGVGVYPLAATLRARFGAGRALPVLAFDGHYDAEGNRAMAEAVASFLLGRN